MRKAMYLLLTPLLAIAAINPAFMKTRAVLIRATEPRPGSSATWQPPANSRPLDVVGSIDTVGGTQYDVQVNGPAARMIVYDPGYGIQLTWMSSAGNPTVDRNMRWNFFDLSLAPPAWAFNSGPDFMLWGVNWFGHRAGFGNLDVDPTTHAAYISAHYGTPSGSFAPTVGRDATPGGGSPEECPGTPTADGYVWPYIGLTLSGKTHAALMDEATMTSLFYTSISPWCTYAVPIDIHSPAPDAGFPDYNIATSKLSNTVAIMWPNMNANPPTQPLVGYYRKSHDDGVTWDAPITLTPPPVFTDTQPSFDITSLSGIFDSRDSLHIVGQIVPFFSGTGTTVVPAVVCHYSTANGWTVIHRTQSDTLAGPVGANACYAGRPSLAEGTPGELVCVWEQFDSLNLEPNTGLLRADIMAAYSGDGGTNWGAPLRIATGGTSSLRFPSVAARIVADTVHLVYMQDLEAGDGEGGEGSMTSNPIIHEKVAVSYIRPGVAEGRATPQLRLSLGAATPSVFRGSTRLAYQLPGSGSALLRIRDVSGRAVRTLFNGRARSGSHEATWDGKLDNGTLARAGVYFCDLTTGGTKLTTKLALLR